MSIGSRRTGKVLCSLAAMLLILSNVALAETHGSSGHGAGGHKETTGAEHDSGGCNGGCGGDEHEASGDEHDGGGSGKGRMRRGGGIVRGHGSASDHGDLHDIFDRMDEETAGGHGGKDGSAEETAAGHGEESRP